MKVELNTNLVPIFSGTYETVWDIIEYDDDGNEVPVTYKLDDLLKGIAEEYGNHADYIKSELDIPFIKSIKFTGKTLSPREYNFNTDRLYFIVDINKTAMMKELLKLKDNAYFNKWLHDNYTSYDGFWSYTPNNYRDLVEAIKSGGDGYEQSIGALINYLAIEPKKSWAPDLYRNIEMTVYDSWQGNGYGGTQYDYEEEEEHEKN